MPVKPKAPDHFCKRISTIVAGDERDCDVCSGSVPEGQLEERKRKVRKRLDRGEYKRELWIPSNA